MHLTRPLKVLKIYDTRLIHSPLTALWRNVPSGRKRWEEAVSQAFGHKAFLLFTWVNRSLHGLGKWWGEFRTDQFWFRLVIAFTICLSQFRLMKNGRESLKLIFKKGLKTWNPNFCLKVSNQEDQENRRMPFQTFRLFQEFSTETSKATRNWVNGKPGKAPKCPLSLF